MALDVTVTPELLREGLAREIVNRIQNIRKDRGYNITDKITLTFNPSDDTDAAIKEYASYISRQVLAEALIIEPIKIDDADVATLSIGDLNINVAIALC